MVQSFDLRGTEINLGDEKPSPEFSLWPAVLRPMQALVPQSIKGELRPDAYKLR